MPRFRISWCRGIVYLAVGLAVCQMLILNMTIMYAYVSVQSELSALYSNSGPQGLSLLDKLMKVPTFRNIVYEGKSGGFLKIIQNTLERVYIVTEKTDGKASGGRGSPVINHFGFDVSGAGEFIFLMRRMQRRGDVVGNHYRRLIVDIGANDGLMSSNSFNLIQLGWDAILVEPQQSLLMLARDNIQRYADPYSEGKQKVIFVNSMIGERDGYEDFVLANEDMESHLFDADRMVQEQREGQMELDPFVVKVPSMTVATFARRYGVPKNFSILSIDAEGIGDKILHQWITEGFRPAYILYEQLHNKEPIVKTDEFLRRNGYRFLKEIGYNYIYEHILKMETK